MYTKAETDLVVDAFAYVPAGGDVLPLTPGQRGRVHAGGVLRVQVGGFGQVPAGAAAAFLNVDRSPCSRDAGPPRRTSSPSRIRCSP